jgi:hypothetical protein
VRLLVLPSKPKRRLEAENAALRRQVAVLQRKVRGRVRLTNSDRLFFVLLYRWFPSTLKTVTVIKPETLVRWHRAGFRRYWRWKSRNLGGRPPVSAKLRALIRRMSLENTLWGAPHIHGELLKLGFTVVQSTVAKYMAKKDDDPSGQSFSQVMGSCHIVIAGGSHPCRSCLGPGVPSRAIVSVTRAVPQKRCRPWWQGHRRAASVRHEVRHQGGAHRRPATESQRRI